MHVLGEVVFFVVVAEANPTDLLRRRAVARGNLVGGALGLFDGRPPHARRRLLDRRPPRGRHRAVVAAAIVEAGARRGWGELPLVVAAVVRVELVELRDQLARLGQLVDLDLAAPDQVEDDLAEVREHFAAPAIRECVPRAAFDRVAKSTGLGERGPQQRSEGSSQLWRAEAATSLPCHVVRVAQLDYRRGSVISRAIWLGLVVGLATGCPPPEPVTPPPIPPVSTGKVRVRVFTEPSPVKEIGSAGRFLFVATEDSIQRWDEAGTVLVMTADHGLSGEHVVGFAPDADRKWLWVLTDGGLGHYDAQSEVYTELQAPPAAMNIDYSEIAREGASLSAAIEGGVWLGTAKGLLFASDKGGWLQLPVKDPVRAVIRDKSNYVWIATKGGLLARKPNGDIVKIGAGAGCEVADPRLIVDAPGDRVMVIGADDQGHERIAVGNKAGWTSYRALPEIAWDAATHEGDAVMLMGGGRVYRVAQVVPTTTVRPLARDGVRLVPTQSGVTGEWVIDPIDLVLPPSPTTLGSSRDELLVGTRDLGTARYARGDTASARVVSPQTDVRRCERTHGRVPHCERLLDRDRRAASVALDRRSAERRRSRSDRARGRARSEQPRSTRCIARRPNARSTCRGSTRPDGYRSRRSRSPHSAMYRRSASRSSRRRPHCGWACAIAMATSAARTASRSSSQPPAR